jgi:hypothetical protein
VLGVPLLDADEALLAGVQRAVAVAADDVGDPGAEQ